MPASTLLRSHLFINTRLRLLCFQSLLVRPSVFLCSNFTQSPWLRFHRDFSPTTRARPSRSLSRTGTAEPGLLLPDFTLLESLAKPYLSCNTRSS
ncbi:hypothetical protein GN244_ATG05973 [Phytophthora infestans]|uniref:Uncharacterized protein n=1 Tax=Phytophthora infestans TaxID=4787 RepID=A0A833SY59_PHYIN|nr:hypothetical protein GN244_ATG05973 [Phytophthora infestans]KAF4149091.1 hypothetical protein GN958_ATG01719 [Phytophthora infestans]